MSENEGLDKGKESVSKIPIQEFHLIPKGSYENESSNDEIDIFQLLTIIWNERKTILFFLGVSFILGIIVIVFTPKEYLSSAKLMPEYSTESQSSTSRLLQQYGGLFGLNNASYNSSSNAIRVDLYPQIVSSFGFQDNIAQQKFYYSDYDTSATLYEFYSEIKKQSVPQLLHKYTFGLPSTVIRSFINEDKSINETEADSIGYEIVRMSKSQVSIIDNLKDRVKASLDEQTGIITISARMNDPELAANVAKYTVESLTKYLTDYRTEKVLRDLNYIETQLGFAKERFELTQLTLAEFRDSNQGPLTARAKTEEQRLNSEYDIAFNIYNTLTQQFEEAKLKVQEETPVFKVLQPVRVPVRDESNGVFVLILFLISGLFLSFLWLMFNNLIKTKFS